MNIAHPDLEMIEQCVRAYLQAGTLADNCTVVHDRSGGRGMLLRIRLSSGQSMIVKAWALRNLRERVKQRLGISNGHREWNVHCLVQRSGIPMPLSVAYAASRSDTCPFEMMVVEDLGRTVKSLQYLKRCLGQSDEDAVGRLEDSVITMTGQLVRARIIDVDHQLNNIVVNSANEFVRIDFECARRQRLGRSLHREYGVMIGRLICSHAYACQPALERTEQFAAQLASELKAPPSVLAQAKQLISRNLDQQYQRKGIDSRLSLAW